MASSGRFTLAVLHDLALLYLALAHETDNALGPGEEKAISELLRQWQPDKDPKLIDHVIRDAVFSYINREHTDRVPAAVATLGGALPPETLVEVLHDLKKVAQADGHFAHEEGAFIRRIAAAWRLDFEQEAPLAGS